MVDGRRSDVGRLMGFGLIVMTLTHTLTHVFAPLFKASFPIIREEFGLSIQQLGVIAAIPPLFQAILSIPAGMLTDRFGSKRMLIASLVVAIAGSLLAVFTTNPLMLIVAVSLVQLNTTIYHPASYSYVTRTFTRGDRPKALGVHGAGGTFGMSLGPLTLGLFMGSFGLSWRAVYLFWAFPVLLGTALSLKLVGDEPMNAEYEVETPQPVEEGEPMSLLTKALVIFLIYTAIRTVGMQMIGTFMPLYIVDEKGFSTVQMNFIYGVASLTGLFSAPLGGVIASRLGSKRWLISSISISLVLLALVSVMPGGILFVVVYIVYRFTGTLGMAARSNLVAKLTPSSQRGVGYALMFLPGSIMGAITPILAAYLIGFYGIGSLFPVAMGMYVVSLAILVFLIKERPD
ncbi:MAG: MFS transporter [Candidatus Bathyarchaeota archaeon]|nr:MAG: MFS transporter [Candidatus Bathyarchaeota archaeon]